MAREFRFRAYNIMLEDRAKFFEGCDELGIQVGEVSDQLCEMFTRMKYGDKHFEEYMQFRRKFGRVRVKVLDIYEEYRSGNMTIDMCVMQILNEIMKVEDTFTFQCIFNDAVEDNDRMRRLLNDVLGTFNITIKK